MASLWKGHKSNEGKSRLYERLINGQDDLGCLLKSPLSTPSAPTVTSAAPHTPGEMVPGKKKITLQNGKGGLCVCDVGQEY